MSVCRCPAYPWPHRVGSGRCEGALHTKFPVLVDRVIESRDGLTLVELSDGSFAVGLCYRLGMEIDQVRPLVDLFFTRSFPLAEHFYRSKL